MGNSGSTSSGLAKGKKFIKKLLYVQHVDEEKDMTSEIPALYLEVLDEYYYYLKAGRTHFHDPKFTEYLKTPKANLSILQTSMEDKITKVTVYSNPLPIPLQLHGVTFHAFVVFQTVRCRWFPNSEKETWWSLEKNGHHIVLQHSSNEDDVINKIYDAEKEESVERLGPIKKQKSDSAFEHVSDLMRSIVDTNMLNEPYHLLFSNCQNFASFVFEQLTGEMWTTAVVDRLGLKKKKIQPNIKEDVVKYKSILNDDKFPCYKAMMEGRRKDFKKLTNNLMIENLNSVDSQGYTPLEWATVFSSFDWPIDEELKKKGAAIPSDEGLFRRNVFFIALQYLPKNKKSKLLKLLSFDGIDVNGVNGTGDTALHLALNGEKWEIAEEILNQFENYDVNITNSVGDTPLHLAARLDCEFGLFQQILNRTDSENVNKVDANGRTAIHYAIWKKSEIATKALLAHKDVDVNKKNMIDETALYLASKWKDIPSDLFNLILEKSADEVKKISKMDRLSKYLRNLTVSHK